MVRGHVGEPFSVLISRSSVAERRLDKAQAGGSCPPARTNFISVWRRWQRACFGNTRPQVRDLPPRPIQRALGCGRSSMAELRDVTPPVPVRLRPATPKRMRQMRRELEWQRTGLLPRMVRVQAPGDAPHNNPLVAE